MSNALTSNQTGGDRRITWVAAIVVVQSVAAVFFLGDAFVDLANGEWGLHIVVEMMIAFSLFAGVAFGALEARRMIEQARRNEISLNIARGALAEVMTLRFEKWELTAAESEIALFVLKGFETAEIAALREVAESTVRAQLTSIYSKAGVSSRHGLASLFLDDLIELNPAMSPEAPENAP